MMLSPRLTALLGLCTALGACGPAYRDSGYGSSYPSYGYYADPTPSYYAPTYSRSYQSYNSYQPYYAPRYEPRYEPRHHNRNRSCYRDGGPCDRDDNPPGPRGGPGTNWENPPGPRGGPGASPDRRRSADRDRDGRPDWWDRRR